MPHDLRVAHIFAAPRDRVFAAWTSPDVLRRWWAAEPGWTTPEVAVDLRVGGGYRLSMADPVAGAVHTVSGSYLEVDPPGRLVYTWRWELADAPTTVVTVEFAEVPGGTEVVVTHTGFPDPGDRDRHGTGWRGCLANLDTRVLRREDVAR